MLALWYGGNIIKGIVFKEPYNHISVQHNKHAESCISLTLWDLNDIPQMNDTGHVWW